MEDRLELMQHFLDKGGELYLPQLSVDSVVFGFEKGQLKVLLLETWGGVWGLPGGFIQRTESINEAATRVLEERTQLSQVYLKQFYVFGDKFRDYSQEVQKVFQHFNLVWKDQNWLANRFVSIGYYALVDIKQTSVTPGIFSKSSAWIDAYQLPKLMMDHQQIIEKALDRLRKDLDSFPIAYKLLPQKFTMPELHEVVQVIRQKTTDRSRFQKKMFSFKVFKRLDERREGVPYRRPYLYCYENTEGESNN